MYRQLAGFRLFEGKGHKPTPLLKIKVRHGPGKGQWPARADKDLTLRKTQAFDWGRKKSHPWG